MNSNTAVTSITPPTPDEELNPNLITTAIKEAQTTYAKENKIDPKTIEAKFDHKSATPLTPDEINGIAQQMATLLNQKPQIKKNLPPYYEAALLTNEMAKKRPPHPETKIATKNTVDVLFQTIGTLRKTEIESLINTNSSL